LVTSRYSLSLHAGDVLRHLVEEVSSFDLRLPAGRELRRLPPVELLQPVGDVLPEPGLKWTTSIFVNSAPFT
jgi:hypothetical protein